eukprot:XP_011667697.1 PREDICTED: plexin-B1-like [Strongylocentrotus purpuratus]
MCTHDKSSCQPGETVVNGENNDVGSGNKGQSYCPQLLATSERLFIPVNISSGYSLLANNLPTEQTKVQSVDCILRIDGVSKRVPSSFFNESYILCSAEEYMFNEDILEKNVSVSVQWNGQYDIDDPTDTYVTLYKCSVNGGSCSRCLSEGATPSILNCGWCDDDCNVIRSDVCQNNQFLSQNDTKLCAAPVISDFYPLSVAINAQTRLEITGTDLGVEFDDVLEIVIGDLMCSLTDMGSFYQPGQSVSCMTGLSTGVISGRIEITVRSGESIKTGESSTEFLYRDPIISGFSPTEGQVAGGTEITVTGMYLNTGRNIEASFGEAQCNNLIVDDTTVLCITSSLQMNEQIAVPLTMTFDGLVKRFEDYSFIYNPNPIINGKYRTESILSGGLDIKLTGQRFDLIQEPRIIVSSLTTDASNSKLCNGTETILICPTPSFPDDGISTRRRRATNGVMTANLTFDFDGYIVDGGLIEYYPDPMYESFSGPNRIYASSNGRLDITGINLDLASTEDDVQVLLGPNGVCHVDVLEIDVVRCQLPEKQPLAGYENGSLGQGPSKNLPAVTVLHGNVRFSPGFVSAWATEGNPLIVIVIPVAIIVPILIIIPMIILAWWFRKKQLEVKRAKEEVKMIRMNILKRVREVSNTSLDLSEADERVQKQGVPFVGNVRYVTMMLFAGLGIHPESTEPEIRNGSHVALIPKNHGDEYQTLDLKEVSSKTYESLQHVTVEMIPESHPSQPASNAIHLKGGVEELTRKRGNLPDHMNQMKANLDRNLAIPHMLTMKASISPYVDGIFEVMFKKPAKIPLPVKYLFDTFDALAIKYAGGGLPEDCADKWKKNCLSNFWSSVLTNLPSMFEMPRSETADRCVIALACALNDAATTKTLRQAESDHLPYYNEHPLQRKMMTDYCTQVTSQPKVRPGKLNKACSFISKVY